MREYPKINTLFKRDMTSPRKGIIEGDWAEPAFEYLSGNQWDFTEKVDGTNIRVSAVDGMLDIGGRTDNASIPAPLYARLQERFASRADDITRMGVTLYGEGYGGKIQSGGNYAPTQDFVLFDVLVGQWWLNRAAVADIGKTLDVPVVPSIGQGTLFDAIALVKAGLKSRWGDFIAEGIVARPVVGLLHRDGSPILAKIKHKDFL